MKISVYVDGSGGSDGGFGFFVKETGESFYEKKPEITNNQAEYMAIISALKKFLDTDNEIIIEGPNAINLYRNFQHVLHQPSDFEKNT